MHNIEKTNFIVRLGMSHHTLLIYYVEDAWYLKLLSLYSLKTEKSNRNKRKHTQRYTQLMFTFCFVERKKKSNNEWHA